MAPANFRDSGHLIGWCRCGTLSSSQRAVGDSAAISSGMQPHTVTLPTGKQVCTNTGGSLGYSRPGPGNLVKEVSSELGLEILRHLTSELYCEYMKNSYIFFKIPWFPTG